MARKRTFTTLPVRAIGDQRLSGLELRCLAVISMHDGMSLPKGSGAGCFASSAKLAALVRTDVTNMSKAISRLVSLGYIVREPQQMDRRRFTLRVVFGDDDSWRNDQSSSPGILGEATNDRAQNVGDLTNHSHEIVGDGNRESGGISSENPAYYNPLRGELDFEESSELNSDKRRNSLREPRGGKGNLPDIGGAGEALHADRSANVVPLKKDRAEALAIRGDGLQAHLPQKFWSLPDGAKLAHLDKAIANIGYDFELLTDAERRAWAELLEGIWDANAGEPIGRHAERLHVIFAEEAAA